MLLPTELTLHTTKDGVRMFSKPVKEVEQLFESVRSWNSLSSDDANKKMNEFDESGMLRIKTTINLSHATSAGLNLFGQGIIDYDLNFNLLNGRFYSPQDPTSMKLTADIYIDKTSIEVFIDGGAYSYSMERKPASNNTEGFRFWGNKITVEKLEVYAVKSIW